MVCLQQFPYCWIGRIRGVRSVPQRQTPQSHILDCTVLCKRTPFTLGGPEVDCNMARLLGATASCISQAPGWPPGDPRPSPPQTPRRRLTLNENNWGRDIPPSKPPLRTLNFSVRQQSPPKSFRIGNSNKHHDNRAPCPSLPPSLPTYAHPLLPRPGSRLCGARPGRAGKLDHQTRACSDWRRVCLLKPEGTGAGAQKQFEFFFPSLISLTGMRHE